MKMGYGEPTLPILKIIPIPESSGTAFFTYAMAWGINNGILGRKILNQLSGKHGKDCAMLLMKKEKSAGDSPKQENQEKLTKKIRMNLLREHFFLPEVKCLD